MPTRHHATIEHAPFGSDRFGRLAERFARLFGTPHFLGVQTLFVAAWITFNAAQLLFSPFDPYPFILLNLLFSTQAAYSAPLILLAQTRQADRDKLQMDADARHREEIAAAHTHLLERNLELVQRVERLAEELRPRPGMGGQ